MIGLVVAVVVVVLVGLAMVLARYTKHPEQTAGHGDDAPDTTSDRLYGSADRPAGPDVDDGPGTP